MRKRNILTGLSLFAMMAFATACSDDLRPDMNQGGGSGTEDGPGVYMGVNFTMPAGGGTRSYADENGNVTGSWTDGDDSSSDGIEIGSDVENNVNEVLLILARKENNGFIAAATVPKNNLSVHDGHTNKTYHARAKFELNDLDQFYNKLTESDRIGDNCAVKVFLFCNATKEIVEAIGNAKYDDISWTDIAAKVSVENQTTEGSIWSTTNGGNFLMSSSELAIREIPGKLTDWDNYTTADKCFYLSAKNDGASTIDNETGRGAVKVERAAARLDFKDGSESGDQTYPVLHLQNEDGSQGELIVSVRLGKMALVNMCNSFYYLSRVSNDGTPAGWELCGPERPWFTTPGGDLLTTGNYLVGPYWSEYLKGIGNKFDKFMFSKYFNYPFFDDNGILDNTNIQDGDRWGTVLISEIINNDNYDNWQVSDPDKHGSYHIWRYLTPNLIPGTDNDYQQNGISTGVVFKGKMLGNKEAHYPDPTPVTIHNGASWPTADYDPYDNERKVTEVLNNDNQNLGDQTSAPILYMRDGRVYYTFQNVYDAVIMASFSYTFDAEGNLVPSWNRSNSLFKAVFGQDGGTEFSMTYTKNGVLMTYVDKTDVKDDSMYGKYKKWKYFNDKDPKNENCTYVGGKNDEEAEKAFKEIATNPVTCNFTIYQRSHDTNDGWGYYCYYYHWIRHNDNGRNGIMGPMEFQVVRNNVYKLSVRKINALGHPRISMNDPDSPKPDTPDEQAKIYMAVDAEVIPWVVRVNDIVFE